MRINPPVTLESHALGTLNYIRASIESAGSLAVPGLAGVTMGTVGLLAAVLTSTSALASHWLEIWLVAAAVALIVGGTIMARQAALRGRTLQSSLARKFALCLCPGLFAGAVLTFILWQADMSRLIPGMWLLLYGCAVMAASTMTSPATLRLIATMGALFVTLGVVTFSLPVRAHTWMLGAGFGALHLLFAFLIARANHVD